MLHSKSAAIRVLLHEIVFSTALHSHFCSFINLLTGFYWIVAWFSFVYYNTHRVYIYASMYCPVFALNKNAVTFVQHKNKILNVGHVSSLPLSQCCGPCVSVVYLCLLLVWSVQSTTISVSSQEMAGGREGSQERQMRDREKQGREGRNDGEWLSRREWGGEEERRKPVGWEWLWRDREEMGVEGGRETGRKEDLMNVDHCPST